MNYEPSHPIYRYKLKNLIMKTPYVWLFALVGMEFSLKGVANF